MKLLGTSLKCEQNFVAMLENNAAPALPTRTARPIVICDDHEAVRAGLERILADAGYTIGGNCGKLADLLAICSKHQDAILILDLGIEGSPFPALAGPLLRMYKDLVMIVYSGREDPKLIKMVYDQGVKAFVPKISPTRVLLEAIDAAADGQVYITTEIAKELKNHQNKIKELSEILSKSELHIFTLYCKTLSVEAVAKEQNITEKRVNNVLSDIAKKLNANRMEFPEIARRYQIL